MQSGAPTFGTPEPSLVLYCLIPTCISGVNFMLHTAGIDEALLEYIAKRKAESPDSNV